MKTTPVIAIHGGAGTIASSASDASVSQPYHDALRAVMTVTQTALRQGASALDAVCIAVEMLEESPLFNAGYGAVFTHDETHELDAAVMSGADLRAGAVAGVARIRRPVRAARAVLVDGVHVLLCGAGAEAFARGRGLEMVDPSYFSTDARRQQLMQALSADRVSLDHDGAPLAEGTKFGTVGAVALDMHGHLAAATSTGGMTNKRAGRIGDSPLIGAGTYADDRSAAVSCTGSGEMFIRAVAAYDVCARMRYGDQSLEEACEAVVKRSLPAIDGRGGLIAVDRLGNVCMPFNTDGMYRAFARGDEAPHTAIHR
jgi:beta-aspartyl-peptidase (threonine type)